jgi:PAS domain S-box-containing protein
MSAVESMTTRPACEREEDEAVLRGGSYDRATKQPRVGHVEGERLHATLANVPHGLCMFDAHRRLVLSNSRYAEMYSLPAELLVPGTSLATIVAYRARIGNAPANFPGYVTHEGIEFNREGNSLFEFMLQDGRTIRINHLALNDGGYIATHEDVTEAVRSEARFHSIFDAVSEGIFILDAATASLTGANQAGCAMLGYLPGELSGRDVEVLASGAGAYTREALVEWIKRALASGQPQRFDWQSRATDGRTFPVQIAMRFAAIGGDEVVLAIVRDLTEREAIEAQLRQSQKMEAIGQLSGGMAHDFNNLLSIIIGNLDFLAERLPAQPELRDLLHEALDAALQGADLTKRLLAFARVQPLQPKRLDINELIHRISRLLRRTLGESIEIVLDHGDDVWSVHADPAQLEASLVNIANNARDAMPNGGVLRIATTNRILDEDYVASHPGVAAGSYAMIEISDSGAGIPPEILGHIFEPFFTTKELGKGTGLGLSMVFGFIEQSGGHIGVYSEVELGTTFQLYLPPAPGAADTARLQAVTPAERGGRETILAVEDNSGLRRILAGQLKELGYRMLEAEDGPTALKILDAEPVHLLLSDVVMPGGLSGYDLARTALLRWPEMKIVLTSGFSETKLNGNGPPTNLRLLVKPYRKAELARVLREALDG